MFHVKHLSNLPESIQTLIEQLAPESVETLLVRLERFRELVLKVNPKINLVSRSETEQALSDLLYDSVALLQFIDPIDGARILDLGSGAGFPGLVIASAYPRSWIISVEANRRKIEFQRQVARELKLSNVELVSERIENVTPLAADIALAKAFASIETICKLLAPHVAAGGEVFLPRSGSEDLQALDWHSLGFELSGIKSYQSGTNQRQSHLIHIKKS